MLSVIELFAGIGSQRKALQNLGVKHNVVGISEINKYAIQAYEAIHGSTHNFGDIKGIKILPYCDLLTYSFPCISVSVAGSQLGLGIETSSGLLWQVERLLDKAKEVNTLPKYLLLENVKNLVGKKFINDFNRWLNKLEELGYKNYWKVLNSKDFNVPQNRERVFCVSIRSDIEQEFKFPEPNELKLCIQDIMEYIPDEKYYLSEEIQKRFKLFDSSTSDYTQPIQTLQQIGELDINAYECRKRVYSNNGVSPTILASQIPKIFCSKVRNLTPKECFRLQAFTDEDYLKCKEIKLSDTQLYKIMGNSITVSVLEAIFTNLFM